MAISFESRAQASLAAVPNLQFYVRDTFGSQCVPASLAFDDFP
jgi:hypothetical protein